MAGELLGDHKHLWQQDRRVLYREAGRDDKLRMKDDHLEQWATPGKFYQDELHSVHLLGAVAHPDGEGTKRKKWLGVF